MQICMMILPRLLTDPQRGAESAASQPESAASAAASAGRGNKLCN